MLAVQVVERYPENDPRFNALGSPLDLTGKKSPTMRHLVTVGILAFALCGLASAAESPRPNIILILADDLGWSDIGPYGSEIATPNLDRLASGGLRFTQFHNTSKCFPSRAALLTGLYAQQVGMDRKAAVIRNGVTLGEVLQSGGYRTYWTGKHHGTENPYDRGFDHYYGLRDGACNFFNPGHQRPGEGKPAQKRPNRTWYIDNKLIQPYTPPKDFYTTDYFTNYAIRYLEEDKDDDRPFFLYVAYTAPHDPLMAWPEDIAKYRGKYQEGYEAIRQERYRKQLRMGLVDDSFPLSASDHRPWDSLSPQERTIEDLTMAVYAAMIDRLDQNIGKILAKVRELGQEENTLVIFASDNGASSENVTSGYNIPGDGAIGTMERWTSLKRDWANVGNTPYRYYKNYSYEGGICTPFIVYWPKFTASEESAYEAGDVIHNYPGHFIDVMPTLAEVSGAPYPSKFNGQPIHPVAGESLMPVLRGELTERSKPLYFQWARGRAVRRDNWKIVSSQNRGGDEVPWELYNLAVDKTETRNLAAEKPALVKELARLYENWYARVSSSSGD
ncbi:MAG: arylsulfatase [Bryobacterales bacterium]|nr:arylsulfatase [Bryobacterales bacterium]